MREGAKTFVAAHGRSVQGAGMLGVSAVAERGSQ